MFDIVYIVSHGFASRMVTQTNLLGKLVQAGKSVALISPDKEDIVLKITAMKKASNYMNSIQVRVFGQASILIQENIF